MIKIWYNKTMITMIIALAVSCGVYCALNFAADWSVLWSAISAVGVFMAFQILFGIIIRKKIMAEMQKVQLILAEGQKKVQAKVQRWQMRPPGSIQAAQKEIADDMRIFVKMALAETENLSKFRLFVPMIDRQKATAQFQLNWMIKEFSKCDALMPKVLMADPTLVAIKMARMYMLKKPLEEITQVYTKGVRRLRYNQNVLLAACYSWILMKSEKVDEAFKALTEALKSSDNPTLKANHELLMNNRSAHFSNSGLGDQWYQLHLEEPKVKMQRQRSIYR